ncbi:MAG: hypothetical protein JXA01_04330 [Dehalococcoidia bacterium]|nr:hypothetical protein [Dehalococcoidia bacterium]
MNEITSLYPAWVAWVTLALMLWTIPWKGVALWRSARNSHKAWFIVLLILNTLAILEIIYIFGFSKNKPQTG